MSTLRFLALRFAAFAQMCKAGGARQNVLPLLDRPRDSRSLGLPGANISDAGAACPCRDPLTIESEHVVHRIDTGRAARCSHSAARSAPRAKTMRSVARWVSSSRSPSAGEASRCARRRCRRRAATEKPIAPGPAWPDSCRGGRKPPPPRARCRAPRPPPSPRRSAVPEGASRFMPMMRLDDFHVVPPRRARRAARRTRCSSTFDADAGVRRDQHRDHAAAAAAMRCACRGIEAGGAHQQRDPRGGAGGDMLGDAGGPAEIDGDRRTAQRLRQHRP